MCRVLLCLSLWSAPLPMLHAHEKTGPLLDRDTALAEHVQVCHAEDDCEHCRGWHLHLVLWGEVQSDHPDSDTHPQSPQPRRMAGEFAITLSACGTTAGMTGFGDGWWASDWVASFEYLSPASSDHETARRANFVPYQVQVANCRDVDRLLMVARC